MRKEPLDFPKSILIETSSLCQGECKFCPYPEIRRGKNIDLLTEEKFKDLLDEIKNYYVERLTLFNNNEPLLDRRIYSFISESYKVLPEVEIGISSNGRVITYDILKKLKDAGLTTLYISIPCVDEKNYEEVMGTNPTRLFKVLEEIEDEELFKMIRIAVPITKYCDIEEIEKKFSNFKVCSWGLEYRSSWGIKEKYKNLSVDETYPGPCDRPMDQAVISSNGDVIICCRDWKNENVVGNVYEKSLYDIWHDDKMKNIQKLIAEGRYNDIACCKDCTMNYEYYNGGYKDEMSKVLKK